jgi:hypothetical protein
MSAWVTKLDLAGQPHTSIHRDGHKVGLFPDGLWWAYHKEHRVTRAGQVPIGPKPAGPFLTLQDAQRFVEVQGWASSIPFSKENAS